MSYILDALRRAEAQRSRGSVPTLHAPAFGPAPAGPARAARPGAWLTVALVALVLVATLALWLAWRNGTPAASPPAAVVAVPPPPVLASAPAQVPAVTTPAAPVARSLPAATALPPPAATESAPRSTPPRDPPPQSAAVAPRPPVPPRPQAAQAPVAPPRPPVAERAAAPVASPPPASVPATRATAVAPPVARRDLPADLQRELPALALNGTVYSPDPAQRMALVNGEVWREGDRLGPELFVDEIRRQDAVLRYKGQRFILGP